MADAAPEPLGIMTHDLVHDPACWSYLVRLFAAVDAYAELESYRGPPPADWPAWRRDRAGTGYSLDLESRGTLRSVRAS